MVTPPPQTPAPAGQKGPEKEPEKEAEKQSQKESQKEPQKEPQQEREVTRTPEGVWKHGRFYGDWKPDRYLSPIDREELSRLDLMHKVFLLARNDALYTSISLPDDHKVAENPTQPSGVPDQAESPTDFEREIVKVLDLGTGTGIWAINVLDVLPEAEVEAADLNRIQPAMIPRGLNFYQVDLEEPSWEPLQHDCHLVHTRCLLGSIRTDLWPNFYKNAFEHTLPRRGYFEQVEIDYTPRWDGGDVPEPSAIEEWSDRWLQGHDNNNRSARVQPQRTKRLLEEAGFTDVKEETIRCWLNPNPSIPDPSAITVARWFNVTITGGLEAISYSPMIDHGSMTKEEVEELCSRAKNEMCALKHHAYLLIMQVRLDSKKAMKKQSRCSAYPPPNIASSQGPEGPETGILSKFTYKTNSFSHLDEWMRGQKVPRMTTTTVLLWNLRGLDMGLDDAWRKVNMPEAG